MFVEAAAQREREALLVVVLDVGIDLFDALLRGPRRDRGVEGAAGAAPALLREDRDEREAGGGVRLLDRGGP